MTAITPNLPIATASRHPQKMRLFRSACKAVLLLARSELDRERWSVPLPRVKIRVG